MAPEVREAVLDEVVRRARWSKEILRLAPADGAEVAGAMLAEAVVSATFQGCDVQSIVDEALAKHRAMTTGAGEAK